MKNGKAPTREQKVIMAGDINVTVRNVVQSARGKE